MRDNLLTPEELLAGAEVTLAIEIPPHLLRPVSPGVPQTSHEDNQTVELRPLSIGTFQLIMKAAKNDAGLIPLLMIKESLVQPSLSLDQIKRLPLGLVNFLMEQIRQISGLTEKKTTSMS